MVLESTVICVDNSEFMRNGDFPPTRLQSQQDAVHLLCHAKSRSNPENNLGLLTLATNEVLTTLTSDRDRVMRKLRAIEPHGNLQLISGLRIAHLVLKHRQGKNHKMRIVCFIGSPITCDVKELVKLAKRLKKENVSVDVVNFGESEANAEKLKTFIETLNGGKDNAGSHLLTVAATLFLSTALNRSPIIQGEDGGEAAPSGGFEFGVDPNEDPELAMALRVSLDEMRQQAEAAKPEASTSATGGAASAEEQSLEKALKLSMQDGQPTNLSAMTEDEQMAYALQMSLQDQEPMETDEVKKEEEKKE